MLFCQELRTRGVAIHDRPQVSRAVLWGWNGRPGLLAGSSRTVLGVLLSASEPGHKIQ